MKKRMLAAVLCLGLIVIALGGCAGAGSSSPPAYPAASSAANQAAMEKGGYAMGATREAAYDMAAPQMAEAPQAAPAPTEAANEVTGGGESVSAGGSLAIRPNVGNRKIIYTASVSLQTTEFDTGVSEVERMTTEAGGFVQSSNVQGRNLYERGGRENARYAHYTVRVPQEKLSGFLSGLEGSFNVGSLNVSSDDITLNYFDTKARLESLYIQRDSLMEMLGKAEDVEYLIEVQKELARVGYEIESYTSSLNRMDDALDYSTVHLSIEEVLEYTPAEPLTATFGEQVGNAFTGAWKSFAAFCRGLALGVVSITPLLVFAVPIAAIAVALTLRRRKKRRMSAQQPPAAQHPTPSDEQK